jgi:hypothetical protein
MVRRLVYVLRRMRRERKARQERLGYTVSDKVDLELRRKTCAALGWDVIEPEFCENDTQRELGIGRPPRSSTTQILPAIEFDPGIAITAFREYADKYDLMWSLDKDTEHPGCVACLLYAVEVARDIHAETCDESAAAAICKAIVIAAAHASKGQSE